MSSAYLLFFRISGDQPAEVREAFFDKLQDKICDLNGHNVLTFNNEPAEILWTKSLYTCIASSFYDEQQVYAFVNQIIDKVRPVVLSELDTNPHNLEVTFTLSTIIQMKQDG